MSELFYKLPQALTARPDLPASAKLVYSVIVDHIGRNSKAWPGIGLLMSKTGLARQTVLDSIKRLELAGLLSVERRGNGKSNHYQTGQEIRPVKKLDRSKKHTPGSPESRPEPDRLIEPDLYCKQRA